jgi:hypothetical protein
MIMYWVVGVLIERVENTEGGPDGAIIQAVAWAGSKQRGMTPFRVVVIEKQIEEHMADCRQIVTLTRTQPKPYQTKEAAIKAARRLKSLGSTCHVTKDVIELDVLPVEIRKDGTIYRVDGIN